MAYEPKRYDGFAITKIAVVYVMCLLGGGLAVLNAFLHAGSVTAITICAIAVIAALVGVLYCTRAVVRTLTA